MQDEDVQMSRPLDESLSMAIESNDYNDAVAVFWEIPSPYVLYHTPINSTLYPREMDYY